MLHQLKPILYFGQRNDKIRFLRQIILGCVCRVLGVYTHTNSARIGGGTQRDRVPKLIFQKLLRTSTCIYKGNVLHNSAILSKCT